MSGELSREEIPVIYEDNHLLVVVKPVNMPTQEDESKDLDLLTALKQDLKTRHAKPGNVFLGLVHRLDRPVGGVMVFGKTSKASSRLSDAVRTRSFGKRYLAVVHGRPEPAAGSLTHYLLKDTRTNTVKTVAKNSHPDAKEAVLDYEVLAAGDGYSLVRIELHTGRSHQIRVQMAAIGCPLYGDQKYGAERNKPGQQLSLWSVELSFEHPTLQKQVIFNSTPPPSFPWSIWETELLR
ncbi:MAG: RluA family pseudouridine synthase [Paenibacillaceae bacterium]|jgi:23S rRNA pseudouridine1911/1915/1917 synthase|nr:RluA family pseudouridine synthase [Paenibacillaceae bacterium]